MIGIIVRLLDFNMNNYLVTKKSGLNGYFTLLYSISLNNHQNVNPRDKLTDCNFFIRLISLKSAP